jgi:hypothetical protein
LMTLQKAQDRMITHDRSAPNRLFGTQAKAEEFFQWLCCGPLGHVDQVKKAYPHYFEADTPFNTSTDADGGERLPLSDEFRGYPFGTTLSQAQNENFEKVQSIGDEPKVKTMAVISPTSVRRSDYSYEDICRTA